MKYTPIFLWLFFASFLLAEGEVMIEPKNPEVMVGELLTVQVKVDGKPIDFKQYKVEIAPADAPSITDDVRIKTYADGKLILQAPISLSDGVSTAAYKIIITRIQDKPEAGGAANNEGADDPPLLKVHARGAHNWEARAIAGYHQAGASSADHEQNFFFDFFVARPFGAGAVYNSSFNLWGQVRIASSPQQKDIPLSDFAVDFAREFGSVPVNELAQSGEFLTGIEYRPSKHLKWGDESTGRIRTLGFVAFFGANGTFTVPDTMSRIFRIPGKDSPQWDNFVSCFPAFENEYDNLTTPVEYIGLIPPDRERFYRQYGAGIRYTSYAADKKWAAPAMFTATIGQDQSISHGRYIGAVLKFDAFYPLPVSFGANGRFLYLFGTANLAIAKPKNKDPLALELVSDDCPDTPPAPDENTHCGVQIYQSDVAVFTVPSSRDTYRVGVGIDFISLLNAWK